MFLHDDDRAIMSILSKRSSKGEALGSAPMKPESVKDENGEPDPRHAAAQDIMSAFHEKSADKLMQALANFHDLHSARMEPEEE